MWWAHFRLFHKRDTVLLISRHFLPGWLLARITLQLQHNSKANCYSQNCVKWTIQWLYIYLKLTLLSLSFRFQILSVGLRVLTSIRAARWQSNGKKRAQMTQGLIPLDIRSNKIQYFEPHHISTRGRQVYCHCLSNNFQLLWWLNNNYIAHSVKIIGTLHHKNNFTCTAEFQYQ